MGNCLCFSVRCVNQDEYLVSSGPTNKEIISHPGVKCIAPWKYVKNHSAIRVAEDEYLLVRHLTGELEVVEGPTLFTPQSAFDTVSPIQKKILLKDTDYAIFEERDTGRLVAVYGPTLYCPRPLEAFISVEKKCILTTLQYTYVKNERTGEVRTLQGPLIYEPEPFEKFTETKSVVALDHRQYVRVVNKSTGALKIVKGECKYIPTHLEDVIEGPKDGVYIDDHTAVLVRDTKTGDLSLVEEKQLFIPKAEEEIEDIQDKIILEEYEVMVIIDSHGEYFFKNGMDIEQRSFFLNPHCSIMSQEWSMDLMKEHQNVEKVQKFDLRATYMNYEFFIRTLDSVEIIVDSAFFWQVVSVEKLIAQTADPPRDICNYARSVIVEHCSHETLEKFINTYNKIMEKSLRETDEFYTKRGIKVHSVQVLAIHCKDPATERVLQEIIQETTNRINRRQKQESDNEVKLYKMRGDIEEEKLNGDLLAIRHQHLRNEALMEGQAEADRVKAFIDALEENLDLPTKVSFFESLRTVEKVNMLASKANVLYVTPEQCDLKISRHETVEK